MKVVFFGTPLFIEPVIKTLKDNFDLVETIRKPVVFDENKINELESKEPDIFVVASYGKILPAKLLDIPKLGCVNIHPSLLPKYRGPSPIQNTILNGDKVTGVTFIKMDEEVDHGPILKQIKESTLPTDTFESLADRLFKLSAQNLENVLNHLGETKTTPQDESKATFTKLISKKDGYINESNPPEKEKLMIMIRAYFRWPGVWTHSKLSTNGEAKTIKLLPKKRIQVEGKKPMSYHDFKNGYENGEDLLKKLNLN